MTDTITPCRPAWRMVMRLHFMIRISVFIVLACFSSTWPQVSGTVVDYETGEPVSDALVTLQATEIRTVTDASGRFELTEAKGSGMIIVGAKKGYYNGYSWQEGLATEVEIQIERVPQDDNTHYEFVEPSQCGECHDKQLEQWTNSPMANAGINTWVYDIYSGDGTNGGMGGFVYLRDSAYAHANPASECASCHQPEPWVGDPHQPMDPVYDLSAGAQHGVSCDICHKVANVDEGKPNAPGIYPGAVTLTRPAELSTQVQYGVLGDTNFENNTERMRASYQPQLTTAMCGTCHQDKNDPDEDGDYEEANGVISEPTYLEWLDSPYGDPESPLYATCVDCHMPPSSETLVSEGWFGYQAPERDPETIRSHRIEGTTARFLENAVTMEMTSEIVDQTLKVNVEIFNDQAGHHVPDGVTIRNMVLLVEAWRVGDNQQLVQLNGEVLHELAGVGDPAKGYYAGLPGVLFAKVNRDASGNGPTFFTDAAGIQWDNRIPALGTDESSYAFALPDDGGLYEARARLIYRRAFRFLVDAKGWTEDGHGRPLEDMQGPHYGHLMEEATWSSARSTAVVADEAQPAVFALQQNYPNPFNPETHIVYQLAEPGRVELRVYNLLGEAVRTLVDQYQGSGRHELVWNGRNESGKPLAAGIYMYKLMAAEHREMRKMVLIK